MGGAAKDLETLDYTKDKEKGDSVLPNAVYLPDAGVSDSFDLIASEVAILIIILPLVCWNAQRAGARHGRERGRGRGRGGG